MSDNILIITGGTGGHVFPAVNFFKYLEENNKKVFILTDHRGNKYINDAFRAGAKYCITDKKLKKSNYIEIYIKPCK